MFYTPLLEFGVQAVHELRNDTYSDIANEDSKNHAPEALISDTELIEAIGLPRLQMRRLRKAALQWNSENNVLSSTAAAPETSQAPEHEDRGDIDHVTSPASQSSPATRPSAHLRDQSTPKNRNRNNQSSQSTLHSSKTNRKATTRAANKAKDSTWGRRDTPSTPKLNQRSASQGTSQSSSNIKLQQSKKVSPASAAFLERMVLQEEARRQRLAAKQAQAGIDSTKRSGATAQHVKKTPKSTAKYTPSREPGSPNGKTSSNSSKKAHSTQGRLYTLGKKTSAMTATPKTPASKGAPSSEQKQLQSESQSGAVGSDNQTPAAKKWHGTSSSPGSSPNFGHRLSMKGGHAEKEKRRAALRAKLDAATLRVHPCCTRKIASTSPHKNRAVDLEVAQRL